MLCMTGIVSYPQIVRRHSRSPDRRRLSVENSLDEGTQGRDAWLVERARVLR